LVRSASNRSPTFQNALVQNIGGGNTMVFNRATWLALRATPADVALVKPAGCLAWS